MLNLKFAVYKDLIQGGYFLLPGVLFADLPDPSPEQEREFTDNHCDFERCNMHGGPGPSLVADYYHTIESCLLEK